jgi:hypothetical protein
VQYLDVAPAWLALGLVLIVEGGETESRRALCGIGQNRDCIVEISLIAYEFVVFIQIALVFDDFVQNQEISFGDIVQKGMDIMQGIIFPIHSRVLDVSDFITAE